MQCPKCVFCSQLHLSVLYHVRICNSLGCSQQALEVSTSCEIEKPEGRNPSDHNKTIRNLKMKSLFLNCDPRESF